MKKPSLDGASIKRFFVYHCEKLILALSVILLGLFFWFGYATPNYDKTTPSKLVDQAKAVRRYVTDKDAWSKISSVRKGEDGVFDRISKVPDVNHAQFKVGPASYPVKREALRRDMLLMAPIDIVAKPFLGSWLVDSRGREVTDPLPISKYNFVQPEVEEQSEEDKAMAGGGFMGMEDAMEGMDMGMGEMEDMGSSPKKKKKKKEKKEDSVDAGTYISKAMEMTNGRFRDTFSPTSTKSYNVAGVAVTGLVNHKEMWEQCKAEYEYSFGYHPDRDTPRYDFVEVQRRTVKDDGSFGKWGDISNQLFKQRDIFPNNFDTAPEVVSPDEFDGVTTMPIPPLALNYRDIAMHPRSVKRKFTVPKVEEDEKTNDDEIQFDNDDDGADAPSGRRQSAIGGGSGGGAGGMFSPGGMGGGEGMGMGMGGPGGMYGGGGKPGGGRSSTDYSAYDEVNIREKPESDFKVVRFFDIYGIKANATYEYRVRVWLRDPNNEDPDLKGDISGSEGGMGDGMGGGGGGGRSGGGKGGMGGKSKSPMSDEEKKKQEEEIEAMKWAKKTAIANSMKHPDARERLRKAREVRSKDGLKAYFVSEKVKKEDGTVEWVEYQVPKEHDYLRFARPTPWSSNVKVKMNTSPTFVFAGEPVEARRVAVGRGSVVDGEPSMKVAAGKLIQGGKLSGVTIPFRAEVKAGDLLNFDKPAHVVHPVTRNIHRVSGVAVDTRNVVLDVSKGETLGVSGKTPIDYFFPGEILVMDADGNIKLRNDMDDRREYMASTLEVDEKASIGGRRRRKKSSNEEMLGGMGGPGGMGAAGGGKIGGGKIGGGKLGGSGSKTGGGKLGGGR